nr:nuclear localization sequence-binding protein-like isoform X8 [Lolium perenne]
MAGGQDNLGCCGLLECLCGLLQVFIDPPRYSQVGTTRSATSSGPPVAARERRYDYRVQGLSPSPAARNSPDLRSRHSQAAATASSSRDVSTSSSAPPAAVRGLRSDGRVGNPSPVARNSPDTRSRYPQAAATTRSSSRDVPTVARNSTAQQNGIEDDDDDDDDCVIVAEKGEVACRDFPHSRHLCSNMPFGTTSHSKHCTMCYCFVCDAPAPCSYWGKGLSVDDHCHATDKETKWKTLREAFKQRSNGSGISNGQSAQISHRLALTASALRAHSAAGTARGTSNTHTAQISHPVAPTASAPRAQPAAGAGRGTSTARTALVTHPVEATVSPARSYSSVRTGTRTSNAHTSQITPVEPTVGATRAYSAARFGRDTSNASTSQTNRSAEQTVSAPRVYPGARVGRDSSNAHSAPEGTTVYVGNLPGRIDNETLKLTFQHAGVVLFSKVIYDRETGQSRGFGYVTMNTVQEAETAVRMYNGSMVYDRPLTVNITAPRGSPRVDTARSQSVSPFKIFICNLPTQVDRPRLEELFSKHGKVVDARVIYERQGEDWCSRGFGFVTMATEEEMNSAIRALNKQVLEGHALKVTVAREMRPQQGRLDPTRSGTSTSNARAAGARSGTSTSNARAAQVTHRLDPTISAPIAQDSNLDGLGAHVAILPFLS